MGKERKKRASQKAKAAKAKAAEAKAAAATQPEDGLIEGLVSLMLENWGKLIILLGSSEGKHADISRLESTLEEQLKKFFEFNQSPDIPDSLNVILKGALGNNRTKIINCFRKYESRKVLLETLGSDIKALENLSTENLTFNGIDLGCSKFEGVSVFSDLGEIITKYFESGVEVGINYKSVIRNTDIAIKLYTLNLCQIVSVSDERSDEIDMAKFALTDVIGALSKEYGPLNCVENVKKIQVLIKYINQKFNANFEFPEILKDFISEEKALEEINKLSCGSVDVVKRILDLDLTYGEDSLGVSLLDFAFLRGHQLVFKECFAKCFIAEKGSENGTVASFEGNEEFALKLYLYAFIEVDYDFSDSEGRFVTFIERCHYEILSKVGSIDARNKMLTKLIKEAEEKSKGRLDYMHLSDSGFWESLKQAVEEGSDRSKKREKKRKKKQLQKD